MKETLKALVSKKWDCDYLEIRVEDTNRLGIQIAGKKIDELSNNRLFGGAIRALYKGCWSFVSFNSLDGIEKKVEQAVSQARTLGNIVGGKSQLAPVKPIVDDVRVTPITDIRSVPLSKKMELLQKYNDIMLSVSPLIKLTRVAYKDVFSKLWFATSEGAYIEQEKMDMGCNLIAMANRDGNTQNASASTGSSVDWNKLLGMEEEAREAALKAVKLLDCDKVKSGEYMVILDPHITGTFIHEAFGHLSEGDNVYENPELAKIMSMGRQFGEKMLNVYDTGLDVGVRGYLKYDDEGVPTEKTYLIREGKLVGRLHSRETAGKMGERPTGNARAISYKFPPIPRMRNTCIEVGKTSFEDLIASVDNGMFCKGVFGGQTNGEMFTFTAAETYEIKKGKLGQMYQGSVLQGNVFDTLKNIDMVGSDFHQPDSVGGCGKGGQMPLPTSHGSPSIRIREIVISGK